jgi:3-methyladenine DNA glycosylase AlkD
VAASVALVQALRSALAAQAQPDKAGPMQAYMKSALPFWGVDAPARRAVVTQQAALHPVADGQTLIDTVLQLWRSATHREERYAALDLLRRPKLRQLMDPRWLPVLQELILTGPWWDHNDEISGQALPWLLQRYPQETQRLLRQWAHSDSLWLRRAAMLSQRGLKAPHFDAVLLYDCILPSTGSSAMAGEFFIRKGMGWALRERSYAAPDEVQAFCAEYRSKLSPLTLREALRVLGKRKGPSGTGA